MEIKVINFAQNEMEQRAGAIKAIAHPLRISILQYLIENNKMNVTDIHKILKIEQAITSHHLGILKTKGIVSSQRDGKNTFYSIKNEQIKKMIEVIFSSKI